ncbi:MAG: undecaprenyl-diphosphate phosphatase [Candidatus Hydrogenedens sp.]|nr:undecaprenyl-diphosphate phosphatase [Candidatus Hydrogenedens sp.]
MDFLYAFLLAVIEGITEFLPISSTGHMILAESWLRFDQPESFANAFMVIIQLPAILSVVVYFWKDLWPWARPEGFAASFTLWTKIAVAFLPAAVLGFLFDDYIDAHLFNPPTVATALGVGGLVLIALEWRHREARISTTAAIGYGTAVAIGFFQCLAMIPGTSRSAATIIGAMALGASRAAAAEFSFFLAIPTMLGATALKLLKGGLGFTGEQWALLVLGSVISFVVAYASIALFMRYIQRHSFIPFGVYRIALALLVLVALWAGALETGT